MVASFVEQFQKFLTTQPYAMFASLGLLATSSLGISSFIQVLLSKASHYMSSNLMTLLYSQLVLVIFYTSFVFPHVHYIPNFTLNLISVGQLCDSGYSVFFFLTCFVHDPQSQKLNGTCHRLGGLYVLNELKIPIVIASRLDLSSIRFSLSSSSSYLWHYCLGPVLASRLKYLMSTGVLGNLQTQDISYYSGCKLEKKKFALFFNRSVSFFFHPI